MGWERFFTQTYSRAARLLGQVLETAMPGPFLSVDIGGSFFDCLLSGLADAFGHELHSFPSLLRQRSRAVDTKRPIRPLDVVHEPSVFGCTDGRLRISGLTGANGAHGLGQVDQQIRSIDNWWVGRDPLQLVHFGDRSLIIDQLRGAQNVLTECRPAITVYPPALQQERAEILSMLAQRDYLVVDLGGAPAAHEFNADPAGFGWIGVPNETAGGLDFGSADADPRLSAGLEESANCELLPRQRRSSQIFGLGTIARPTLNTTVDVADHIVINDCYPMEKDGKSSWRWLGPGPRSGMAIVRPFPGTYRFDVAVLSCRTDGGLPACRVLVDGREVPVIVQGEDRGKLVFTGRLNPLMYEGYVEFDFITRGRPQPAEGDPRALRLNIGSIGIAPCP